MKKLLLPFFSCLLVFTLLLGSFGSARAEVGDDPVVTPVSGDMVFTTEVVSIASLPGLAEYKQMLVPVGFPEGEAQFEGAGVRVSGMDSGKATACFTLSTIAVNQGWGGKVGVWNGTKWVLLPTTIATGTDEAANTTACAPITGSGTYTFIKWVTDPDKLPTFKECEFDADIYITGYTTVYGDGYWQGWLTGAMFSSDSDLTGLPVSVRLLRSVPASQFVLEGTGYGTLSQYGPYLYGTVFDDFLWWTQQDEMIESWTFYVTFGNCYKVIEYSMFN